MEQTLIERIEEIEKDSTDKIEDVGKVIDDATPEELNALLEIHDEGQGAGSSNIEESENVDDKTSEQKPPVVKKEDAETTKDDKPLADGEQETAKPTGPITINDDFISKADEKDKKILQTIKGEIFSPKGLQNYINAQREIGRLGSKLGEKKPDEEVTRKEPIPTNIPKQQFTAEIEKLKETEILNRLRLTFKDLPEDPEEADEYINSLPQRKFYQYMEAEKGTRAEVETAFNKAIWVQDHQTEVNATVLNNDILQINEELKEYGIDDPVKYELDLTITKTAEGISKNPLLQELIMTPEGKLDPNLVTFHGRVPIFNEQAIYNKFFTVKGKLIREIMRKSTSLNSRKEAFDELSKHEESANNSASQNKGGGLTGGKLGGKVKTLDDVDNLNPNEVSELLNTVDV